jgi:hypothetical protein
VTHAAGHDGSQLAAVEHVFAVQKRRMRLVVRTIGLARAARRTRRAERATAASHFPQVDLQPGAVPSPVIRWPTKPPGMTERVRTEFRAATDLHDLAPPARGRAGSPSRFPQLDYDQFNAVGLSPLWPRVRVAVIEKAILTLRGV